MTTLRSGSVAFNTKPSINEDANSWLFCSCSNPNPLLSQKPYQFSSKPASLPSDPRRQKYQSTYSLSYSSIYKYKECIRNVESNTSPKDNNDSKPEMFTYLEEDGILVIGFNDGFMKAYIGSKLVKTAK